MPPISPSPHPLWGTGPSPEPMGLHGRQQNQSGQALGWWWRRTFTSHPGRDLGQAPTWKRGATVDSASQRALATRRTALGRGGGGGGNSVELLCGGSVSYVVIGSQIPGQRARAGVLQGSTPRGHPGPRGRAAIIVSTPEVSEARRGGVSWPGPSGWIALVRVLGEAAVLPAPAWAPLCAPWLTRCGRVVDDLSETQFPQFQSRANST